MKVLLHIGHIDCVTLRHFLKFGIASEFSSLSSLKNSGQQYSSFCTSFFISVFTSEKFKSRLDLYKSGLDSYKLRLGTYKSKLDLNYACQPKNKGPFPFLLLSGKVAISVHGYKSQPGRYANKVFKSVWLPTERER